MVPMRVTVDGVPVHGYFYAGFAGIWVSHPSTRRTCFSEIRGIRPEVMAAKLLRDMARRA